MAIPEKNVFFDEHRRHTKGKNEIQLSRTKALVAHKRTHTLSTVLSHDTLSLLFAQSLNRLCVCVLKSIVNSKLCDKGPYIRIRGRQFII